MNEFVVWLRDRHDQAMACETEALDLLTNNDKNGYDEKMREKARILASLKEEGSKHLQALPQNLRAHVESALAGFSGSAGMALKLDSVFFMSALLYNDDHKKGDPDNLALFIAEVKDSCGD